jgi:hypothetical protein
MSLAAPSLPGAAATSQRQSKYPLALQPLLQNPQIDDRPQKPAANSTLCEPIAQLLLCESDKLFGAAAKRLY